MSARVDIAARAAAMRELARRHPDEFEELWVIECEARGIPRPARSVPTSGRGVS